MLAYDVLVAVREQDAYTNLLLASMLRERGLNGRDAAFATELVSGTVRRQGTYDAIIGACVDRPLSKVDAAVLDALRLGAHQILAMRVPTHAAVSTTVELVRQRVGHGPAGFANAVLRKVAAHDLSGWVRRVAPDPATDPVGFASVAYSHPRWVVEALDEALGAAGRLEELLAADNAPPKVTLVARPGLATVDELVAAGGTASTRSPYAVELGSGDPASVPAVAEGRAGVQDEGSQLVALALSRAAVEGRDEQWLDMCAGPGGKSALLASVAAERGAHVLASERQVHRAGLVRRATAAASRGLTGVITADGTRPAWAPGSFDRVLVDAPCSGLGALRRRPESRWRRTPADVEDLVPLQEQLLRSALDAVRPGGVVAYVTCSPVLAETSEVVSRVLSDRADAELEDAAPLFDGVPDLQAERSRLPGTVQLWPHRQGTDAMFFALLRKRADR
ncbi:MAG TPA: transcription antitermination factor NusB [Nocardioidaceae bacterium]|nr:transcription antitermination factor NusB [Nocardioidaceae bacterium]